MEQIKPGCAMRGFLLRFPQHLSTLLPDIDGGRVLPDVRGEDCRGSGEETAATARPTNKIPRGPLCQRE